jgi:hypothetical protein
MNSIAVYSGGLDIVTPARCAAAVRSNILGVSFDRASIEQSRR